MFSKFKFILIYQLDAFVFRDELETWCSAGYSYIGAPWFYDYFPQSENAVLWAVGNGGFSLRNVGDAVKALSSFQFLQPLTEVIKEHFEVGYRVGLVSLGKLFKRLFFGNNTYWKLNDFNHKDKSRQEDYFWGIICKEKFSWFRVPEPQQAIHFSFEVLPSQMFAKNGYKLPMGCHAWHKYELSFWKPFIENEGYTISQMQLSDSNW